MTGDGTAASVTLLPQLTCQHSGLPLHSASVTQHPGAHTGFGNQDSVLLIASLLILLARSCFISSLPASNPGVFPPDVKITWHHIGVMQVS